MGNKARKKTVASKTTRLSVRERLYRAGLDMIAEAGWSAVTIEKIARRTKMPVATATALFPDTYALVRAVSDEINQQVKTAMTDSDADLPLRDRLFDALMIRFDCLQKERPVLLALMTGAQQDKRLAWQGVIAAHAAMRQLLTACGQPLRTSKDKMLLFGLMALYARGLWAWRRDESSDLAATMAALDRMMDRAEQLRVIISL